MVLPGHGVPFYGLKTRIKQLADHHEDRCRLIAEACREGPQTSRSWCRSCSTSTCWTPPDGFRRWRADRHVNYMLVEGRLTSEVGDGVLRFPRLRRNQLRVSGQRKYRDRKSSIAH
jgi:hypothetical protein